MKLIDGPLRPVFKGLILLLGIPLTVSNASRAASPIEGRASVIDGDTIDIQGTKIRLSGIDAAESSQFCLDASGANYRCGRDAAFRLDDMLKGRVVRCVEESRDRYRRIIAECFFTHPTEGEININATMVIRGDAVAYRKYSKAYIPHEDKARSLERGLWQGEFQMPWDWRKANR